MYYVYDISRHMMFSGEQYNVLGTQIEFKNKSGTSLYTTRDLVAETPEEALEKARLHCNRMIDEQRLFIKEHTALLTKWQRHASNIAVSQLASNSTGPK